MFRPRTLVIIFVGLATFLQAWCAPKPRHVVPAALSKNTRELFDDSMHWSDFFWDESTSLVKSPYFEAHERATGRFMVRESSWYALGLLVRDGPGDRERASRVLDAVLKQQYTTPGVRWYGTYRRTPEEPTPDNTSVIWRGYDPNWRVFIGTTFAMILIEYPERIPAALSQRMYRAIDVSLEGEIQEHRLLVSYTNIALMYGFLLDFAAVHNQRADWATQARVWNRDVYDLYRKYNTFSEYNSPTYCGVDLYGLALWRDYGSSETMRSMGRDMEAGLWRDLAKYYQPDLRNLSGPFDWAYGMDMESYVSVVGVWLRSVLDATRAPLPPLSQTTDHLPDIWFGPHIAILGTVIPQDALAKFQRFSGEHLVKQQISADRVATARVGQHVIFGGEATGKTRDAGPTSQFHPATVQWRTPSGKIGWIQLVQCPSVDAVADDRGLSIDAAGTLRLRVHAAGLQREALSKTHWKLPGLQIDITGDATSFSAEKQPDAVDLIYAGMSHMRLDVSATP